MGFQFQWPSVLTANALGDPLFSPPSTGAGVIIGSGDEQQKNREWREINKLQQHHKSDDNSNFIDPLKQYDFFIFLQFIWVSSCCAPNTTTL